MKKKIDKSNVLLIPMDKVIQKDDVVKHNQHGIGIKS